MIESHPMLGEDCDDTIDRKCLEASVEMYEEKIKYSIQEIEMIKKQITFDGLQLTKANELLDVMEDEETGVSEHTLRWRIARKGI